MSVHVRTNELRERITIQSRTDAQDTFGEADPTWSTLATVYAAVRPLQGREFMGSGLELDDQPHEFTFRYSSDVAGITVKSHRITWSSKTFDLVSVDNVDARRVLMRCIGVQRG